RTGMKKGPRAGAFSRVGVPGLEPGASSLSGMRSNRLSYTPAFRVELYRIRAVPANRMALVEAGEGARCGALSGVQSSAAPGVPGPAPRGRGTGAGEGCLTRTR